MARVTPCAREAGGSAPAWLGRGILLCTLFLLMSICHAAVLPGPASAAPVQEKAPVHAVDCAIDIAASTPSTAAAKFLWSAQQAGHAVAPTAIGEPVIGPPAPAPADPPAVRRARLQIFLI